MFLILCIVLLFVLALVLVVAFAFQSQPPSRITFQGPWHSLARTPSQKWAQAQAQAQAPAQRGIVMAAGGKYTPLALKSLSVLRAHGCTLPATIVHADVGELPLDSQWRNVGDKLGNCTFLDATAAFQASFPSLPVPKFRGYQLKPFAVLFAAYPETMLLDADTLFVRDPSYMFDDPLFQATGALFWPDVVDDAWTSYLNPQFWSYVGVDVPVPGPQHESSCVLLDTQKHAESLAFACDLNYKYQDTYKLVWGDKDTWRAGCFMAANAPFSLVPRAPGALVASAGNSSKNFVQHDTRGEPLYVQGEDLRKENVHLDKWVPDARVFVGQNERAVQSRKSFPLPSAVEAALLLSRSIKQ